MPENNEITIVTLTPAAVKQIKYIIKKKGSIHSGLRIGVKGGGCSGYSYVLHMESQPRDNDIIMEIEGISLYIDRKSAEYLKGATLDFSIKNLMGGGGFQFNNPNVKRTCGCGSSFDLNS
jgi:iron-sulfur cluster assembly protein